MSRSDPLSDLLKLTDPRTNRQSSPGGRAIVAGGLSRRSVGSWHCRPEGGRIARPPAGRKRHENSVQGLQVPGYDRAPGGRIKRRPGSRSVTLSDLAKRGEADFILTSFSLFVVTPFSLGVERAPKRIRSRVFRLGPATAGGRDGAVSTPPRPPRGAAATSHGGRPLHPTGGGCYSGLHAGRSRRCGFDSASAATGGGRYIPWGRPLHPTGGGRYSGLHAGRPHHLRRRLRQTGIPVF